MAEPDTKDDEKDEEGEDSGSSVAIDPDQGKGGFSPEDDPGTGTVTPDWGSDDDDEDDAGDASTGSESTSSRGSDPPATSSVDASSSGSGTAEPSTTSSSRTTDSSGGSDADSSDPVESPVAVRDDPMRFGELRTFASDRLPMDDLDQRRVAHTDAKRPLLYRRIGKPVLSYNRDQTIQFNLNEVTATQLGETKELLEDEVYTSSNVNKADIVEAALISGLMNLNDTIAVLDAWGQDEVDKG